MKKTNKPVELTDEQVEKANGGMKTAVVKSPKLISPLLRLIYKIKKNPEESIETNTVVNAPIIVVDNDKE